MYYYFLWAKEAFQESRAYILAPREKVNSSSVTKLSTSSKTLLIVVSFHVLFLILNLYVFAKLAEETDPSIFARKRRFWILCGETGKPFQNLTCLFLESPWFQSGRKTIASKWKTIPHHVYICSFPSFHFQPLPAVACCNQCIWRIIYWQSYVKVRYLLINQRLFILT